MTTDKRCYLLNQAIQLSGSGFAATRAYVASVDGVYIPPSGETDSSGGFSVALHPGGLAAGVAQSVDHVDVTDGTSTAGSTFTLTRAAGARFVSATGTTVTTLRARLQVWGFALDGSARAVYLHYIAPSGRAHKTVSVGNTGGQCGYLRSPSRRVFPFTPSAGSWTLQVDTRSSYARHPGGPVARITVKLG